MKFPLSKYEKDVVSQSGEDGVLEYLLNTLGDGRKVAVEFGAADGRWISNTWQLEQERGFKRWLFDGEAKSPSVVETYLTAENINEVFDKAGVPADIDVLSIDVDGNDFWLWKAITRPSRITLVEYNVSIPFPRAMTIVYDPNHRFDMTNHYGATLCALEILGRAKGLRLVHATPLNGVFVEEEEAEAAGLEAIKPAWERRDYFRLDVTGRPWVEITEEV